MVSSRFALIACVAVVLAVAVTVAPAAIAQAPVSGPVAGDGLGVHLVKPGESLYTIAQRYGLKVDAIARLNGTTPRGILWPGRELRVPLANAINARADAPAASPAGTTSAETDAPSVTTADAGVTAATPSTYSVVPGDTLFGISRRFGLSVDDLRRWNGLPADGSLFAGETLVLTGSADQGSVNQVRRTAPAESAAASYAVQPGDTLSAIARRFDTSVAALKAANGLVSDEIQVGQRLNVSGPGAAPMGLAGAKRVEIDVSEQRMYVYQGNSLIWTFVVSTGITGYPTRRGTFAVQSMIPNAWSSPWQLWMPNWLGIYWAGSTENGIHALPVINGQRLWGGYLGTPISYGCIVLGTYEAELLYNWAELGTAVIIRD